MSEVFFRAMNNPLRSSVMYPPDRRAFAPFASARPFNEVLGDVRGPFGLYAHIPFCETKCTYCDYETVPLAKHRGEGVQRYVDTLCASLIETAASLDHSASVSGFDIGGGTPGALSAAQFEQLIDTVTKHFRLADGFEISTETTPTLAAMDAEKWRDVRALGVQRISVGLQTADDGLLVKLNRAPHDSCQAYEGMRAIRRAGFDFVNVDLMFALPGMTRRQWCATLETALQLEACVLTVYDTVYKNRGIATQAARWNAVPTTREYGQQYDLAYGVLTAAGYDSAYGSVNFSRRKGRLGTSRYLEARILHGRDYIGVGQYASSLIGNVWRFAPQHINDWQAGPPRGSHSLYELPAEHVMAKYALLALSYGGLDAALFSGRFGCTLEERYGASLDWLCRAGFMAKTAAGYSLTRGSFAMMPGIRAMFVPEDAHAWLEHTVVA